MTLRRRDELVLRQLAAAPLVLEAWIDEMLTLGRTREATATLQALFRYLRGDVIGRRCNELPMRHPARIFDRFEQDERFDVRYRTFNLGVMRSASRRADD